MFQTLVIVRQNFDDRHVSALNEVQTLLRADGVHDGGIRTQISTGLRYDIAAIIAIDALRLPAVAAIVIAVIVTSRFR